MWNGLSACTSPYEPILYYTIPINNIVCLLCADNGQCVDCCIRRRKMGQLGMVWYGMGRYRFHTTHIIYCVVLYACALD